MASTSAHFNLTKPATTDYYNIGVFNDNTDIIDTQMYNNQVSAAKIMVGATANDDGESGRVPVPHAGDQNKYLCADGTWKTVGGGGGGSSVIPNPTGTPTDTLDTVSIDGTIYEIQGSGGGGSAGKFDTLWTGDILVDDGSAVQNITLAESISDYDFLLLRTYDSTYHFYTTTVICDIDTTYSTIGAMNDEIDMTPIVKKVDDTHITLNYYGHNGQSTHYVGIYGIKVGGGGSGIDYSTSEQDTGVKWIDGSTVYEKVISISNVSLSSGSYETVDTITELDTIISCNGYVVEGNLKYTLNDISLRVIQDGTSVKLYSPSGTTWTISSGAIIIRYIKASS